MRRASFAATILTLISAPLAAEDDQRPDLAPYFGFGPMQIYKLKPGISLLTPADLNGDGRTDVALWNGLQSRFEFLYQPAPDQPAEAENPPRLEPNELPDRGPLRRENIAVAYRVASMDVGDFTGDGRTDIVFFGEPRELVVLPALADGGFGPPVAVRAPEADPRGGGLAAGDFNSDGRQDVALLGENVVLIFHQKPEGGLGQPLRLVHNFPRTMLMLSADLDGDTRSDLIVGTGDEQFGILAFLQNPQGTMGAMRPVRIPVLRSITVARHPGGDDVFVIESATGQLKHMRWELPSHVRSQSDWVQQLYSYPVQSRSKNQPTAVGDVTGDGRPDVIAVDPDAAQMILFVGSETGLLPGVAYPSLAKASDVQIGDLDGDGHSEVLVASPEEKIIGLSRYDDGRLTFPTPLPDVASITPYAVAINSAGPGGGSTEFAYLAKGPKDPAERDSREIFQIILRRGEAEPARIEVGELRDDPAGLRFADVNHDGRDDLLLFVRYSPLRTYLRGEGGEFALLDGPETRAQLVKDAAIEGFAMTDVNGDGKAELLLAQKNLARALVVQDGRWTIVDQYNPETADAEITGIAVLPGAVAADRGEGPRLVMYDRTSRELLVLDPRPEGSYRVTASVPAGEFDLRAMQVAPLAAEGKPVVLLADARKLALFTPGQTAPTLVEKAAYETEIRDAFAGDSVIGDINHDGVRDVVLVEMRRAYLEILTTVGEFELASVMNFQVFQGKRFSGEPQSGGQPREVRIADVTGDAIDDIIVLVHDRLIVYPGQ